MWQVKITFFNFVSGKTNQIFTQLIVLIKNKVQGLDKNKKKLDEKDLKRYKLKKENHCKSKANELKGMERKSNSYFENVTMKDEYKMIKRTT